MTMIFHTAKLDTRFPKLSALVWSVLQIDLETLASRAAASGYEYYDLERLLADVRATPLSYGDPIADATFGPHGQQARGYLATIEAFIGLGIVGDAGAFITKKLAAPRTPSPSPRSSEMLDTVAECSWGLWLHDLYGAVEAEKSLPGRGDVDFYVRTPGGELWVDCISVNPQDVKYDMSDYLCSAVQKKWRDKFGARPGAAQLPAAIAVTLQKSQENVIASLIRDEITGSAYLAPDSLWAACPGLRAAWYATPPWGEAPHRPKIFAKWVRP